MQRETPDPREWDPPVRGFAGRLRDAVDTAARHAGQPVTFGQLADSLAAARPSEKAGGRVLPASYRSIMNFVRREKPAVPRDATFAKAAAPILGVRWQWLHLNEGPMTDTVEVMVTNTVAAQPRIIGAVRTEAEATVERLRQIAAPIADFPPALATFAHLWGLVVDSSKIRPGREQQFKIAESLWQRVAAPLAMFGVKPEDAPVHYYLGALAALMVAVPGPAQGADLSAPTPKRRK